jgi:hypothetical protein
LPKPSLTPEPAKTADMNSISGMNLCGGNDFSRARLKEDGFSAGKAGGHQVEKSRYVLDSKILATPLKVHINSSKLAPPHSPLLCTMDYYSKTATGKMSAVFLNRHPLIKFNQ